VRNVWLYACIFFASVSNTRHYATRQDITNVGLDDTLSNIFGGRHVRALPPDVPRLCIGNQESSKDLEIYGKSRLALETVAQGETDLWSFITS
jgi:hypothetical protein